MSYEPTNWVNGETPINAENLNKIEQKLVDLDKNGGGGDVDIDYSEIEFDTEEIVVENPMDDTDEYMKPCDLTNEIDKKSTTSTLQYTMPQDGWIRAYSANANQTITNHKITINGKEMGRLSNGIFFLFYCKKGDVITLAGDSSYASWLYVFGTR